MKYFPQLIQVVAFSLIILQASCSFENPDTASSDKTEKTSTYIKKVPINGSACSFEQDQINFLTKNAINDATESFNAKDYHFFGVANGIGPQRPGFEKIERSVCLIKDTELLLFWVGGDETRCINQTELETKAINYAKLFNTQMISLLQTKENTFKCAHDLKNAH